MLLALLIVVRTALSNSNHATKYPTELQLCKYLYEMKKMNILSHCLHSNCQIYHRVELRLPHHMIIMLTEACK